MVQINNLSYGYRRNQHLFDQLNLSLPSGNIYGLLGQNGAGKSTLLKIISGLLFPKGGDLEVVGYHPRDRHPGFLQEVYLITEEFRMPSLSISQYLSRISPFYPRFSHEAFEAYVDEFQLTRDRKLSALSYGQKKKFLLAFGLATDCKLLILDEPTNGLDIPSKSQFRKVVADAIHEDRTFIISTHQVRDMENLIDPIIILDAGEIVFHADYERILQKMKVSKLATLPDEHDIIFSEAHFGGYTVVQENTTGEETNMNLETLFKAVISNKERIYEIFKH